MTDHSEGKLSEGSAEDVGSRYFLPRNVEEAQRMQNQHEWLKGGADGLVLAPIDLNRSKMRVLDAATADGMGLIYEFFTCDANILKATGCRMRSLSSPKIQSLLALTMRKSLSPICDIPCSPGLTLCLKAPKDIHLSTTVLRYR